MPLLATSAFLPAQAQDADFYKGKTLTIVVNLAPGGTADTTLRLFAPYVTKHTPGNPQIVVQNMPGAGGVLATNYLYERAAKDGFTIMYGNWDPLAQALGNQGLRMRYDQFEYLGGISDVRVNYMRTDTVPGGAKRPADIMKAPMVAVGALNNTDLSGLIGHLALEVLGVKNKFVTGYRGGQEIFLAIERGEIQLHNTSISSFRVRSKAMVEAGTVLGLSYMVGEDRDGRFTPNKYIKEMPAFQDLYREVHGKAPSGPVWKATNWLVQQFGEVTFIAIAPPGAPAAAVSALRKGFEGAINDPEVQAQGEKRNGIPFEYVGLEKARAVFKELAEVTPDIVDTVKKVVALAGGGK